MFLPLTSPASTLSEPMYVLTVVFTARSAAITLTPAATARSTAPARASESRGEMMSTSIPCATISSTCPDCVAASFCPSVTVTFMSGNHLAARSGICFDETAP